MMLPAIRMTSAAAPAEHAGAELVTADGRSLPLVSAALRADAQAGLARLVLEQRFENSYDETLHVTYRMPLPADGAVSGYAFVIGERTIVARRQEEGGARRRSSARSRRGTPRRCSTRSGRTSSRRRSGTCRRAKRSSRGSRSISGSRGCRKASGSCGSRR